MSGLFDGSRVLVTGGTGLIGRQLVQQLVDGGVDVTIASLDHPSRAHPAAEFRRVNLMHLDACLQLCEGMDFVFHLAGVKGSPAAAGAKPASFFVPMLLMNTNMMEAAYRARVKRFLYTSTVGVYAPAEVLREDALWQAPPSANDRFAGWAKRMGELQAEAYQIEHGWQAVSIVRPANVYGPDDNFDPDTAMVIPSLIRRAVEGENPLVVWGDGSAVRDFIHAADVARGMLLVMEQAVQEPVNLGSGTGIAIRDLVNLIVCLLHPAPRVRWDTARPAGDAKRVLDVSRARALGFSPSVSIEEGIREVMAWYRVHGEEASMRYNVFREAQRR